jgi:hypothetical protein
VTHKPIGVSILDYSPRRRNERPSRIHSIVGASILTASEFLRRANSNFKLSNDRRFVEKITDVVGLFLDPPDKVLMLSIGEKSQIRALDRSQPGLPMKEDRAGAL